MDSQWMTGVVHHGEPGSNTTDITMSASEREDQCININVTQR